MEHGEDKAMRILHVSLFMLFLSLSGCHATSGGVLGGALAVVLGQHWADHGGGALGVAWAPR